MSVLGFHEILLNLRASKKLKIGLRLTKKQYMNL